MKIGYARTSTIEQQYSLEDQIERLKSQGCEKIYSEKVSSVQSRPEFTACIDFAREGDVVVITKLDRFARSITDLWKHISKLEEKGASLHILDLNLDTSTPNGRLQITLLGGIAQWEREMMLERQKIGIAKAKSDGKYKGRVPTARRLEKDIQSLHLQGMKPSMIAKELNIGVASVYRYRSQEVV
ncbi:MAG TPA: DNA invertase [Colwellia sp.]|nr:DNA invertase [Colwellia sp.]